MRVFEGKAGIITGAGGGIGRATALAFARAGAGVVVADVNFEAAERVADDVAAAGGAAIPCQVDVSNPEDCEHMVAATEQRFGRLDFAFNNAGIVDAAAPPATHLYPLDLWRRMIDIDLSGVFYGIRAELPAMLRNGGGCIVNTASIQAFISYPRTPAYTAAKHGVVGLTKVVCNEYGAQNIRCNAVAPGVARTPANAATLDAPQWKDAIVASTPAGRVATPEEIAEAVVWLCSPAAAYVNGACLPVDGGRLVR